MRFHAKYVSVGEFGDEYFEVSFDSEDPGNDDLDLSGDENPYLIVQRQFEDGDGPPVAQSEPVASKARPMGAAGRSANGVVAPVAGS